MSEESTTPDLAESWASGRTRASSSNAWDEIAAGVREMLSAWDDFRLSAAEYREVDDKQVLVLGHMIGRGKRSQADPAQLGATVANLFHVERGKVTRVVTYYDRNRALADLRLAG